MAIETAEFCSVDVALANKRGEIEGWSRFRGSNGMDRGLRSFPLERRTNAEMVRDVLAGLSLGLGMD